MKRIINKLIKWLAPRTSENLVYLTRASVKGNDIIDIVRAYDQELNELKAEMNEIRRNERRMAELYDLVFEHVRERAAVEDVERAAE